MFSSCCCGSAQIVRLQKAQFWLPYQGLGRGPKQIRFLATAEGERDRMHPTEDEFYSAAGLTHTIQNEEPPSWREQVSSWVLRLIIGGELAGAINHFPAKSSHLQQGSHMFNPRKRHFVGITAHLTLSFLWYPMFGGFKRTPPGKPQFWESPQRHVCIKNTLTQSNVPVWAD